MASGSGLSGGVEVAQPVVAGLPALAVLKIVNSGPVPVWVSARLNLMEGDVGLTVTDAGGAVREIKGWQADTGLHRVELPPGCQLVGAVLLLETPEGAVFPEPGTYRLAAEYRPGPGEEPVAGEPVPVTVVAPRNDREKALAGLLSDPAVRRAILLADAESAPDKLREIGERFGDTLTGRLARLVGGAAEAAGPASTAEALAILALRNPYSRTGTRLAEAYAQRPTGGDPEADRARRLVNQEPVPADYDLALPG